ncbi:hypothetical protein [Agarivorans sp. 1_MG-2023]|uniref:hypothetical protein n=1 Tax=Agarivorans sp. 1_MG-2023 TaxID=3062634 RepID=UPI0026E24C9A|nr:hypothetical protein [Agarivorans sp. 1_MG-2023]MDO6763600.1 hypothetical protein [Agarivorans sp. 1_MG-2023]
MLSIYLILMVLFALAMVPIPSLIKSHKRADKQQQIEHSQLLQSLSHITRRHWRLHAQKLCDPLYSPAELDSTKEQIDEIMVLLQARINYRHCQHLENIIAHWQALSHCEQLAMLRHHHQQILQLSQQVNE